MSMLNQALVIKGVPMSLFGSWQYKERPTLARIVFWSSLQQKSLSLRFQCCTETVLLEMAPLLCNLFDFCFLQLSPFIAKGSFLDEGENAAYLCIQGQFIGM